MYKIKRSHIYSILIAAFFLHLTVLNYIKVFGAAPDIMLICVVFFSLFLGGSAGLEIGFIAGLMKDVAAFDFFGINTFVFAVTGLAVGAMNTKFFRESVVTQSLFVLFSTIFSMSLHFAIVSFISKYVELEYFEYFTCSVIPVSIYTSLVSIPIFSKLISVYGLTETEEFL